MLPIKVILTGATGMVGEGVLLHCLNNEAIAEVLLISRKNISIKHRKLKILIVNDFNLLHQVIDQINGEYKACFFCAGISSIGMKEAEFTQITYTTTINFAKVLQSKYPEMIFNYVSGTHTNINGKQMWQRVKGKTEKDLTTLGFKAVYNFRPGFMKPVKGQKNVKWFLKPLMAILPLLAPKSSLTLNQVGQAMINTVLKGYHKSILEIRDIKELAKA